VARLFGEGATGAHWAWLCVVAGLGLSALGVYAIDVASYARPGTLGEHGRTLQQLIFLAVGLLAAGVVALPNPHTVRLLAWPALAVTVGLLVFLLIPWVPTWLVRPRNGCRGWIDLGVFDLQPSELAKVAFVLASAEYLRYRKNHRQFWGLVPPGIIAAVPVGLILLQPDLGTASLFVPAVFAMLLAAGARLRHLLVIVLLVVCAGASTYPFLKPYQKARIVTLLGQFRGDEAAAADPNAFQARTAVVVAGAGQATGYADGQARTVLRHSGLPERHNDMVFAVISARFGVWGALGTLLLYAVWMAGALLTAAVCRDGFGRLVAVGLAAIVSAQVFINVGMNVGLVPIVGLTLPFVSYGGSSMVTVWLMTGLIFGIAARKPARMARPAFEFR
jgi:cell division protein FtsW (lipid II flippase)